MSGNPMLSAKVWAVVGDVLNSSKAASRIVSKLEGKGRQVYKVNPRDASGTLFKSLTDVQKKITAEGLPPIEAVNVVIHPAIGVNVIKEAADLGLPSVWLQPGADTDEVVRACQEHKLPYHKGCVLVEM